VYIFVVMHVASRRIVEYSTTTAWWREEPGRAAPGWRARWAEKTARRVGAS
jgi:hypothetical protein